MQRKHILIVIIIAVLLLVLIPKKTESPTEILENYSDLRISQEAAYLEKCNEHINDSQSEIINLDDLTRYCAGEGKQYAPSIESINKLKSIQNLRGLVVCQTPDAEGMQDNYNCSFQPENLRGCNKMFDITYRKLIVRLHTYVIELYDCNNTYYLYKSTELSIGGPPAVYISKISPDDKQIIEQIK